MAVNFSWTQIKMWRIWSCFCVESWNCWNARKYLVFKKIRDNRGCFEAQKTRIFSWIDFWKAGLSLELPGGSESGCCSGPRLCFWEDLQLPQNLPAYHWCSSWKYCCDELSVKPQSLNLVQLQMSPRPTTSALKLEKSQALEITIGLWEPCLSNLGGKIPAAYWQGGESRQVGSVCLLWNWMFGCLKACRKMVSSRKGVKAWVLTVSSISWK